MAKELAKNLWGEIVQHEELLELRWLASTPPMTDGAFLATLGLLASEAAKACPRGLLIDAAAFRDKLGGGILAWRDAHVVPRCEAGGVHKLAFVLPAAFPNVGTEAVEGPTLFVTRWFANRDEAIRWLTTESDGAR